MFGFLDRVAESPRHRALRELFLFASLSPRELRVVDGLLYERRYLKGEIIFDQGEAGEVVHIVMEGQVLICRQGDPTTGKISEVLPGSLFGEIALLEDAPRAFQARAQTDCLLASLSRGDLERLLETQGAIASKILLQFARSLSRSLIKQAAEAAP